MPQALLCDELKKAKEDKDNAKKAAKQAAKVEKNCLKRRARLLKARHGSFRSGGLLSVKRRHTAFADSQESRQHKRLEGGARSCCLGFMCAKVFLLVTAVRQLHV